VSEETQTVTKIAVSWKTQLLYSEA